MTTPTQIRLTELDKKKLADIQEWYGLAFLASAVRLSIHATHEAGPPVKDAAPKRRRAR